MVLVSVNGVQVDFPYEPYDIQLNYMKAVITALQKKQNALLESPTGTGKTLCLLCASLAWLDYEKVRRRVQAVEIPHMLEENAYGQSRNARGERDGAAFVPNEPRIIYASRTHSQLAQVMQELKKTRYAKGNRVAVLGSRDQMCIHPQVSQMPNMSAKNKVCRTKVKTHSCAFYEKLEATKEASIASTPLADIEELVTYGKANRVCPYYLSKASEKNADIMFIPYNYIFDPSIRRTMKLDLDGAIVILDEGHNVGRVSEDSYSYEISSIDLATCISELKRMMKQLVKDSPSPFAPSSRAAGPTRNLPPEDDTQGEIGAKIRGIAELQKTLLAFEKAFEAVILSDDANKGIIKSVSFLQELFDQARVNKTTYPELMNTMQALQMETEAMESGSSISAHNVGVMQKFQDLMGVSFSDETTRYHDFFRVYMRKEDVRKKFRDGWSSEGIATKSSRVLSVWCLSPGCTMKTLMGSGIHSMIITSGTLSPIQPLLQEMAIPFQVQLCNPHIIKGNQVWVGVCPKGPDNFELTSVFKNRDSVDYRRSLGRTLTDLFEVIPDGVLIFFPSYRGLADCVDTWKTSELWDGMCKKKACFVEPTNRGEFNTMLADYFKLVRDENENGAAFFGVCRGKISEGVDFPDSCARAVIVTGLPFPSSFEPKIRVKMEYLRETYQTPQLRTLSSNDWYNREAWSAVNQALGRVIRHINDYGACVLLDCRFDSQQCRQQLSGWLRDHVRIYPVPLAKRSLADFYRDHLNTAKPKVLPAAIASDLDSLVRSTPKSFSVGDVLEIEHDLPVCSQPSTSYAALHAEEPSSSSAPSVHVGFSPVKRGGSVFDAISSLSSSPDGKHDDGSLMPPPDYTSWGPSSAMLIEMAKKRLKLRPIINSQRVATSQQSSSSSAPVIQTDKPDPGRRRLRLENYANPLVVDKPAEKVLLPPSKTSSSKPSRENVVNLMNQLKKDLTPALFGQVCIAFRKLKDPTEISCEPLVTALKLISDSVVQKRLGQLLLTFIPPRCRKEYDKFLKEINQTIVID